MSYLVLVRHGKSEWNEKGLWTGWRDIPLAPSGFAEAQKTAATLKDIKFDYAYTSALIRAQETLDEILKVIGQTPPVVKDQALNEKNYGDYTEKNKWQIKEEVGDEEFQKIRRSWDYVIPNGESLKMVYDRAIPYYKAEIEPKLREGKNILISAHNNSLRAIVKYLENIPDDQIPSLEIGTGEAYVYQIDPKGHVVSKEIRGENPSRGKV